MGGQMGRRGPRPKPTSLKVFEGNRGKRKLPCNEPAPSPVPTLPKPPEWLADEAVKEWHRIGPELIRLGLFTSVDVTQLAAYCECYAEVIECKKLIESEGRTVTTEEGAVYQHPAVGQYHRGLTMMRNFASDFGLSPASRVGLIVEKQTQSSVMKRTRA